MNLTEGKSYYIRFYGRVVIMRFVNEQHVEGFKSPHSSYRRNACTRYHFYNLESKRNVILKSRSKILGEITT